MFGFGKAPRLSRGQMVYGGAFALQFFLFVHASTDPVDLQNPPVPAAVSDGPYLQFSQSQGHLTARWLCQGTAVEKQLDATKPIPALCGYTQPLQLDTSDQQQHITAAPVWQFSASRIAAISDIHGQYDLMRRLLRAAGVLDQADRWNFGEGHLVVVGDVMDRGDGVTQIFWLLYQLQQQAKATGGAVHVLPGNHETMVLRGDFRYLNERYQQVNTALGLDQRTLYAENTVLGQWLRRQPLFVRINDALFIHAGLSPALAAQQLTPEQLQQQFSKSLGKSKDELKSNPQQALVQGSDGPVWYRGFFRKDSDFNPALLQQQLQGFGASRVIVGHTTMDQIYLHHDGLVLSTDSDIKDGAQGEVLHFANGHWFKTGLDGQKKPLTDGGHTHKNNSKQLNKKE